MRREEKRRKFHEAVLNTLFPPPPSPPPQEEDEDKNPVNTLGEDFDVGLINPDDYGSSSTSSGDDDDEGSECWPQKLTRAQRKRLRKKKLKEDAERRGKLIGPLLPTSSDGENKGHSAGVENNSPGVRQNADEESADTCDNARELSPGCINPKKLKHRRLAKRVAREQLKLASGEINSQDQKH